MVTELDRRWTAPGRADIAAWLRLGVAAVIGTRLALRDWSDLADIDAAFSPEGLVAWIPSMPPGAVLTSIQLVGLAGAAVAIWAATTPRGARAGRPALIVAWLSLLILAGIRDAVHAKVLHNDVLMLVALFPVAVSAGDAWISSDERAVRFGWPRRLGLAVVGIVYFLTAYQKLRVSGLSWVTSDNLRWVLVEGMVRGGAPTESVASWMVERPLLCNAAAATTLLIELSAPVVLAVRATRPWFLVAAAALHGGIWLTLGLDYWGWILTVAVLVAPWERLVSGRSSA